MKGIIVDRKGRHAVVLTGDGSFIKIQNKEHYKQGYEVEFEKPYQPNTGLLAKVTSIAAAFLFTIGLSYGVYSYTMPYSYIDFDVNPSIELTANIYDIIIKTETFNKDGEKLLESHKLNYKKLDAGISELIDSAIELGYLKVETENAVLLTITSKDGIKKEKLEKHVEDAALKALDEGKVDSDVISQQVSSQKHDTAKDMGISPGKLNLIEKAMTADPDLKLDDLKGASVKTIMKHIKESRKEEKAEEKQNKNSDKQQAEKQGNGDKEQDREIDQSKEDQSKEDQDKDNKYSKEKKEDEEDKDDDSKGKEQDKANSRDNIKNDRGNNTREENCNERSSGNFKESFEKKYKPVKSEGGSDNKQKSNNKSNTPSSKQK